MGEQTADSGPTVQAVTSLFAQTNIHTVPSFRLHETSPEERTEALQDLHGASDVIEESPEFVREKLEALDLELFLFDNMETREAYDEAVCQNEGYVRNLRLAFLRAEKFNVAKAARRMMAHFTKRRELFQDPELLGRDIRLSDLQNNESDVQGLKTGKFQLLTHRDRAGRPIIFVYPMSDGLNACHPVESWERVLMWYGLLLANMGDEVQKKGMVWIWYGLGMKFGPAHTNVAPKVGEAALMMPIAMASSHFCFDSPHFMAMMNALATKSSSAISVFRMRSHCGSHTECQLSLMTYGIPSQILPIQPNGALKLQDHEQFLNQMFEDQKHQHQQNTSDPARAQLVVSPEPRNDEETSRIFAAPGPMDVILGKGQRGSKTPGNLFLRRLLQEHYEEYLACSKVERACITEKLYQLMRQAGYRFLQPYEEDEDIAKTAVDRSYRPDAWVEVDGIGARKRIAHRFRNMRQYAK